MIDNCFNRLRSKGIALITDESQKFINTMFGHVKQTKKLIHKSDDDDDDDDEKLKKELKKLKLKRN